MGGSSGGGGNSGAVSYPAYMQTYHGRVLDNSGAVSPTSNIVAAMNTAWAANPFTSEVAYDPTTPLGDMDTQLAALKSLVDGLAFHTDFDTIADAAVDKIDGVVNTETMITTSVAAFKAIQDNLITNDLYPRFEGGMRDIGAVMTSAFTIGKAAIESASLRDVAKYQSDLRIEKSRERASLLTTAISEMVKMLMAKVDAAYKMSTSIAEAKRIRIVALKEQTDRNVELDDLEARWPLGVFEYGNHVLASIAGAAASHNAGGNASNKMQSALGGAMAGAAAGASFGPWGAAAGGAIGLVAGLA